MKQASQLQMRMNRLRCVPTTYLVKRLNCQFRYISNGLLVGGYPLLVLGYEVVEGRALLHLSIRLRLELLL